MVCPRDPPELWAIRAARAAIEAQLVAGVTPAVRKQVLERDNGTCQWCGDPIDGYDYSLQHRRPRGMGGSKRPDTNQPQNLITACGSGTTKCHGYMESHRDEAYDRGFLVFQGRDPQSFPVQDFAGVWWVLFDDGTRIENLPY